jgi:carboxylate-amine ligase
MDHAFGTSSPFSVGVEEELLLVEPPTYALAHTSETVLAAMALDERSARHDIYAAQIELSSPPSTTVGEAVKSLAALRRALAQAGGTGIGAGLHPQSPFGEVEIVQAKRYTEMAARLGGIVRRTPDCALHVHIGMPDAETAIRVCNGLRRHLPLFEALGANSPFWHGVDSGFASARRVLRRSFPRVGIPPPFRDFDDYERAVAALVGAGELPDYTLVWWEVRPHPRFGTVELRATDSQSSLGAVAGIAALAQALARQIAENPPAEAASPHELEESSFRAGRYGLGAMLREGGSNRPARDVAREALSLARPHARALGASDELEEVERILREGGGADRQRMSYRSGGMRALLESLAAETMAAKRMAGDDG